MELALSTAISFVISYVANCLPIPTKSFDKRLTDCYHRALDKWNVPQEVRDNARDDMSKHLVGLKEVITHTSKGHHPKECELIHLWAEEVLGDPDCNQFVLANQHEVLQIEMQKGFLKVDDVLEALDYQKKELEKISQRVQKLLKRGVVDASTYWDMWATGDDGLKLRYDIVLSGREKESELVQKACNTPMFVCIESNSLSDAIAFSVATILNGSPANSKRALIIDNADTYKDFINESTSLIIITNVHENPYYPVSKGHSVILCGTPSDKIPHAGKLVLPPVDREGFRNSLKSCGFDDHKITSLIQETKRESALLRRTLEINIEKEAWMKPENNKYYLPAILLGSWDETREGDKDLAARFAGMDYSEFDKGIQLLLNSDEPPLVKVGSIWQISSPKLLLSRVMGEISADTIEHFKDCLDWVLEDDDPDVIAKRDATNLQFWQDKHLYSSHIRSGLLQSITIMSVVLESQGMSTEWIDSFISNKLKDFSLERFLSNKHNLRWMAESSPVAFLNYLEDDLKTGSKVMNSVFEIKHTNYSLVGSEIYYSELLFCLEGLAWDVRYLPRVTAILLDFCKYPNDSNYSNKPINSLLAIYRFTLPQTLADFNQRIDILQALINRFPKEVCDLCIALLNGIGQTVFMPSSHFRWRYSDQISDPEYVYPIPAGNVIKMTELVLSIIEVNPDNLCKLIELSTNDYMRCSHDLLISKLNDCEGIMKGNEEVVECLRKNINKHLRCKSASWAIKGERLTQFQDLLERIESDDVVAKNKHFFADFLVRDFVDDMELDFPKQIKESRSFRKGILENVINEKGLDGVWELSNCVGNTDGLADAFVELSGDTKRNDIYSLYCAKKLNEKFVRRYFLSLYSECGKEKYLQYIDELRTVSEDNIGIVLYAPEIVSEISAIVDTLPGPIQKVYWENVSLWGLTPDNVLYVVERLRSVNRFADIFRLIHQNAFISILNGSLWLEVLLEAFDKGQLNVLFQESFEIAEILKCISVPDDPTSKGKLILIELMMFDHLRHHMNDSDFHLMNLVNQDPEIMMELVQLAYRADEGCEDDNELSEQERDNRVTMARLAWNFFYHYHGVPGMRPDKSIDGVFLKNYLSKLQKCAEQCHRVHVMPLVIGRILGNMPEIDGYPTDLMCELVEYFNDDHIDSEISCCISNRRGMSTRSPYAGGDIERSHIEVFKKYRDRALTRSTRLAKVFENEIKSFEHRASIEDEQGRLADLNY